MSLVILTRSHYVSVSRLLLTSIDIVVSLHYYYYFWHQQLQLYLNCLHTHSKKYTKNSHSLHRSTKYTVITFLIPSFRQTLNLPITSYINHVLESMESSCLKLNGPFAPPLLYKSRIFIESRIFRNH